MQEINWEERIHNKDTKRESDVRSEWARDYGRLIHSAAFRRLQSKTQVLGLGESDFYRTRLTHSMEVSQIGVGIIRFLQKHQEHKDLMSQLKPSTALMSTICLAHDLGHPPFGHGGEIALNMCMREFGGFEGNAQTLRILSKLEKATECHGLNPTRRLLLGVLKYPGAYGDLVNHEAYGVIENPLWLSQSDKQKPPKCFYDTERNVVDWIFECFSDEDRKLFLELKEVNGKHKKTLCKSFDCSVMELADDISYSIHDLEDAISLGLITKEIWEIACQDKDDLFADFPNSEEVTNNLFSKTSYERKRTIGDFVNFMISNTTIKIASNKMENPILKYNAYLNENAKTLLKFLGDFVYEKVIKSTNVQLLEFKGQKIVVELFKTLSSDPTRLLPESTKNLYKKASDQDKNRVICDYISGMTDVYATSLYEKLFLPNRGSIFDSI